MNDLAFQLLIQRLDNIELLLKTSKTVLNLDEVCEFTGLSKSYIYKQCMNGGNIPHYKQAKHLYFDRVEIENWLRENQRVEIRKP